METNRQIVENKDQIRLAKSFEESGISFQQWCAAYIRVNEKARHWQIEREEYPVSVGGKETRIDFVAKARAGSSRIITECKLANHAYKTWLFTKSTNQPLPQLLAYRVEKESHNSGGYKNDPPRLVKVASNFYRDFAQYQSIHAIEIKKKGSNDGEREKNWALDPIQKVAYQVSLAYFGFIKERWDYLEKGSTGHESFFPVVFTMAELQYAEYEPLKNKVFNDTELKSVPWIIYHHGVSELIWEGMGSRLSGDYAEKTIPILMVNTGHMDAFFESLTNSLQFFI